MSTLNLFPARVPIGKVRLPDGQDGTEGPELDAYASMEFLKALKVLFDRVGGSNGMGSGDFTELITQLLMTEALIPTAPEYVEPVIDYGPQVAAATGMIDEVRSMQDGGALFSEVSALRQQVEQLAQQIATPAQAPSYADFLHGYAEPQAGADWEHPGKIGAKTASTGAFTTLSATGLCDLSAAGAGQIKFPATQNASADANTLDDYEEGTWTATVVTTGTQPTTPVTGTCYYTKVGRLVTLHLVLSNFTVAGATGDIYISGMPFACASAPAAGAVWSWNAGATAAVARADVGSSDVGLFQMTANTRIAVTNGAGQYLYATVSYIA